VVNRYKWANLVSAIIFVLFIANNIFLINYSRKFIILAIITVVSVAGCLISMKRYQTDFPKINRIKSRKNHLEKELNDEWEESPKLIFDRLDESI
jgi:uncharacterized membrane protein